MQGLVFEHRLLSFQYVKRLLLNVWETTLTMIILKALLWLLVWSWIAQRDSFDENFIKWFRIGWSWLWIYKVFHWTRFLSGVDVCPDSAIELVSGTLWGFTTILFSFCLSDKFHDQIVPITLAFGTHEGSQYLEEVHFYFVGDLHYHWNKQLPVLEW